MNAEQFRHALSRLGLTQTGAARLFDINERTVRRWAADEGPIPRVVALLLRLIILYKVNVHMLMEHDDARERTPPS
jgi:DNA-binding transcriptional regulator YiaG